MATVDDLIQRLLKLVPDGKISAAAKSILEKSSKEVVEGKVSLCLGGLCIALQQLFVG